MTSRYRPRRPFSRTSSRTAPDARPRALAAWRGLAAILVCAVPLATPCGARTNDPEPTADEPRVHARIELPTIGDGKPTGVVAGDLDGDGASELIAVTMAPPALQIWSRIPRAARQWPEPRALPIGDFALGPVWFGPAPTTESSPALLAFASRTLPSLTVVDARRQWKAAPDAPLAPEWQLELRRRPRVLISGDLGHDGRPELGLVTIDDDLWIVRSKDDVVEYPLTDQQATCAAFGTDGRSIFVGFQVTRRLVRYTFDPSGKLVEGASVKLDGLPRAIDVVSRGDDQPPLVLVAGGDGAVWRFVLEKDTLKPLAPLDAGAVPIAVAHGALGTPSAANRSDAVWISIALHGQDAIVHSASDAASATIARFYAGQHPGAVALGDFDGNGATDVAITNGDAKRVSVVWGLGGGRFDVAPAVRAGRGVHSLAAGDLDGDGRQDVVALSALEGTLDVLANKDGVLQPGATQGYARSADALTLTDLDGDGALDAAFLRRTDAGSVLYAYFGDGHGKLFQRAEVLPEPTGKSSGDLLIRDLDGDGAPEAIVSDVEGSSVALLPIERVAGPGVRFGRARSIHVETGPRALEWIDVDGDARPEIAVALSGANGRAGVAILSARKDASGAWSLEEVRHLPSDAGVFALAVADFDGDGLADVAALESRSESDSRVRLYYQGADHAFARADTSLATGLRAYELRAGDVDGDGAVDLVATAQNNHHVNLWLNGGGRPVYFARAFDLGAGTGPLDVQLVDLDGDGQLEIVVANSFSSDVSTIRLR